MTLRDGSYGTEHSLAKAEAYMRSKLYLYGDRYHRELFEWLVGQLAAGSGPVAWSARVAAAFAHYGLAADASPRAVVESGLTHVDLLKVPRFGRRALDEVVQTLGLLGLGIPVRRE